MDCFASLAMTVAARDYFFCLRPVNAFHDQALGVFGAAPAEDLHPFVGLEILVVLEEVLDLLQRDIGKVVVVLTLS